MRIPLHPGRTLIVLAWAILAASCTTGGRSVVVQNGSTIEAGMVMVLHQRLLVGAHDTRAYIQNGQPTHAKNVDQYYPYCRINFGTLSDKPRHIEPGQFLIERISRTVDIVQARPWLLASRVIAGSASATADEYHTKIHLKSERQPEIEMLLCSHWEDPTLFPKHLSAEQIRTTLEPTITFEKP